MSYATIELLESWADYYGVQLPHATSQNDPRVRLLKLASADIIRHLGHPWDAELLADVQAEALADATCVQAIYRLGQGEELQLGHDDGVASVGGLTLSTRRPDRFSPEAVELLVGLGLFAHSYTIETMDADG